MWQAIGHGAAAFGVAFVVGTLVEYLVHRLMHKGKMLGKKHAEHHRDGWGQGWLGEFGDYYLPTIPIVWIGFLISLPVGIGWAAGATFYAAFAAYAHQLQHENPDMVFWMPRPVHYLHHKHHMWKHNFGIAVDWWDRVFGTYQKVEWKRERSIRQHGFGDFFRITWLWYKEEDEKIVAKPTPTESPAPAESAGTPS